MNRAGMVPIETIREQGTEETGAFWFFLTQGLVSSIDTKISVQVQSLIDLEGTTSTTLFSCHAFRCAAHVIVFYLSFEFANWR